MNLQNIDNQIIASLKIALYLFFIPNRFNTMKTSMYLFFILTVTVACHYKSVDITSVNSSTKPSNLRSSSSLLSFRTELKKDEFGTLMKVNLHDKNMQDGRALSSFNKIYRSGILLPVMDSLKRPNLKIKLPWRGQDEKIRPFLDANKTDPNYSYLRQFCALETIKRTDILSDDSDDALNSLGYYIEILAQEKNTSPAVFYYALKRLKNHWPKQKLIPTVELALSASNEAIRQLQENTDNMNKALKDYPEAKNHPFFLEQIEIGKEINTKYLFYIKQMKAMI